eukprot:COSAG06_NODE_3707_length_4993_cov_331.834083_2_plen_126_part_00
MRNCRSHLPARAKRRNPAVFAALLGTAHARGMIRRRGRRSHSIITYSIIHLLTAAYSIQPYFALYIIVDHQARPCMSPMTRAIYISRAMHAIGARGVWPISSGSGGLSGSRHRTRRRVGLLRCHQ